MFERQFVRTTVSADVRDINNNHNNNIRMASNKTINQTKRFFSQKKFCIKLMCSLAKINWYSALLVVTRMRRGHVLGRLYTCL